MVKPHGDKIISSKRCGYLYVRDAIYTFGISCWVSPMNHDRVSDVVCLNRMKISQFLVRDSRVSDPSVLCVRVVCDNCNRAED